MTLVMDRSSITAVLLGAGLAVSDEWGCLFVEHAWGEYRRVIGMWADIPDLYAEAIVLLDAGKAVLA